MRECGRRRCNIDRMDQQIRDMASLRREKASPAVASPISSSYQGKSATQTVAVCQWTGPDTVQIVCGWEMHVIEFQGQLQLKILYFLFVEHRTC